MGQVVIRNLDDRVLQALKDRARRHRRSLEGELRLILAEAARPSRGELVAEMDGIREGLRSTWSGGSAALLREDRDR